MAHTRLSYRQRAGSSFFEAPARGRPIGIGRPVPVASTSAVQQGFQNFFKKRRATPTPMGTRAPVRGACVSAIAIGSRGAEGTRKKLRAAALAFPTAAAPLISPKLCGPPTGLPMRLSRTFWHIRGIEAFKGKRPARPCRPARAMSVCCDSGPQQQPSVCIHRQHSTLVFIAAERHQRIPSARGYSSAQAPSRCPCLA